MWLVEGRILVPNSEKLDLGAETFIRNQLHKDDSAGIGYWPDSSYVVEGFGSWYPILCFTEAAFRSRRIRLRPLGSFGFGSNRPNSVPGPLRPQESAPLSFLLLCDVVCRSRPERLRGQGLLLLRNRFGMNVALVQETTSWMV